MKPAARRLVFSGKYDTVKVELSLSLITKIQIWGNHGKSSYTFTFNLQTFKDLLEVLTGILQTTSR